jgi:hypothetical protein
VPVTPEQAAEAVAGKMPLFYFFGADFESECIKELPWILSFGLPVGKMLEPQKIVLSGGI